MKKKLYILILLMLCVAPLALHAQHFGTTHQEERQHVHIQTEALTPMSGTLSAPPTNNGNDDGTYEPFSGFVQRGTLKGWGGDEDDEERGDGNLTGDDQGGQGGPNGPLGDTPYVLFLLLLVGYAAYKRMASPRPSPKGKGEV